MSRVTSRPDSSGAGYVFGGFRTDSAGRLFRGEQPVELDHKESAALQMLLARAGQIVTPLQLRRVLWGQSAAPAEAVPRCIAALRDKLAQEDCIEAVYKRGYRISCEVRSYAIGAARLPRLAILPLAGGSGVPEFLGPAITEDLGERLNLRGRIATALAQESVTTLAHRSADPQHVAEAMNADLVLRGRLSASPAHFRLRAEMSRAGDGSQLWIEDLVVERSRLGELAAELADRVRLRLGEDLSIAAGAEPEQEALLEDGPAYELFQRAHHEWQSLQRHAMQDGMQRLLRIAELSPYLVAARVDIANLCVAQAIYGYMSPEATAETIRRVVDPWLAQQTAPAGQGEDWSEPGSLYEALLPAQGWFRFHVARDLPSALSAFERSAHLPYDPWTTRARSMFALSRQRYGEAIEIIRAALRADPYSAWLNARLTWALHLAGNGAESRRQAEHCLAEFPENDAVCLYGALILAWQGEAGRAVELAQEQVRRAPHFDLAAEAYACALACAGRSEEAHDVLEQLEWMSRERFVLNALVPAARVALGQYDAAVEELRIAEKMRSPWFFQMMADPQLKPLHNRPEFQQMSAILMGMEEEAGTSDFGSA